MATSSTKCPHCSKRTKTKSPIRTKMDKLVSRYNLAYNEIQKLQGKCKHPNVAKRHASSTGNYDPSQDCYWTDFECPDCDKRWTRDGSL